MPSLADCSHESPYLGRLAIVLSSRLLCLYLSSLVVVSIGQYVIFYIFGFQVLLSLITCCQSHWWSSVISRNQAQNPYFTLILIILLLGLT